MASSMSSSTLSSSHCAVLLQILRRANAHYSRIASINRISIHPTHHARKRAAALRLTVSIQKALKLDPKQISTIPLPVLDRVITPQSEAPSNLLSPASVYSSVPLTPISPLEEGITSRWSMTQIDSDSDIAQELPEGITITYNSDHDEAMVLCSPTEGGESVRIGVKPASQLNAFPPRANDSNKFVRHLDIPIDVTTLSNWGSDTSSPRSLSTGSTSPASSHGPTTPYNSADAEKLVIRIKRKSPEMDDDMLEKRPKYERKGWTISQRRTVQRTVHFHSGRF